MVWTTLLSLVWLESRTSASQTQGE
jgi:hypothetical protein